MMNDDGPNHFNHGNKRFWNVFFGILNGSHIKNKKKAQRWWEHSQKIPPPPSRVRFGEMYSRTKCKHPSLFLSTCIELTVHLMIYRQGGALCPDVCVSLNGGPRTDKNHWPVMLPGMRYIKNPFFFSLPLPCQTRPRLLHLLPSHLSKAKETQTGCFQSKGFLHWEDLVSDVVNLTFISLRKTEKVQHGTFSRLEICFLIWEMDFLAAWLKTISCFGFLLAYGRECEYICVSLHYNI